MPFTTLIQVSELQALQASGAPVLVMDCSFDLTDLQAGRAQYQQAVQQFRTQLLQRAAAPAAANGPVSAALPSQGASR